MSFLLRKIKSVGRILKNTLWNIFFACIVLIGIIILVYLNRTYSNIYSKIEEASLRAPNDFENYTIDITDKISTEVSTTTHSDDLIYAAIGDSLTAGVGVDQYSKSYPYIFTKKIENKLGDVNLVSYAIPGFKSANVIINFIESVIESKPDIVSVFIGINDVHGSVSEMEFKINYENILKKLTQKTKSKIYVIGLPYIGTKDLIKFPYNYYFDRRTQKFNGIIQVLALKYDVTYIDLYKGFSSFDTDPKYYSEDFFHPNELGYNLWAEILYANFNN